MWWIYTYIDANTLFIICAIFTIKIAILNIYSNFIFFYNEADKSATAPYQSPSEVRKHAKNGNVTKAADHPIQAVGSAQGHPEILDPAQ